MTRNATLLALSLAVCASMGRAEPPPSLADVLADDATLRDTEWIDAQHGWAAGDRGVLLRTTDGGQHWRRVATPTNSVLHAISFIDDRRGWAVGGATRPYTHATEGIVLRTDDGGETWASALKSPLPLLTAVRFFDNQHGLAAGVGSDLYPSGLFETTDGGQSWRPLPGQKPHAWTHADLHRTGDQVLVGALVGARGATATIAGREVRVSPGAGDTRSHHAVRLTDTSNGWLVGDGGLVRVTRDGGRTWTAPPTEPPAELIDWFDWQGVAVRGASAWVVGSPGSAVLHTDDAGGTWRLQTTRDSTPLRDVEFVDDQHGWAVGELGLILHTQDGGQTWTAQRGGGHRAALAWVVDAPQELPAELLAINAAGEGRRSVVLAPFASEHSLAAEAQWRRAHEAAVACGANTLDPAWSLTLEPNDRALSTEAIRELLNKRSDGQALEILTQRIAKSLWTYRPSVVAVPETVDSAEGLAPILLEAARQAIALVESPPPDFTGLAPWKPVRLMAVGAAPSRGEYQGDRVATGDFSSRLAASPAQWSRTARSLMSQGFEPGPAAYRWRTLAGQPGPANRHGDLAAGVDLRHGGEASRPSFLPAQGRLEELKRLAQKQRNMERLMQQSEGDPAWAGQVVDLTGGLEADAGAGLLMQLAESYRETGRVDMTADTLYLLARRYPESATTDASLLWLVRHYASAERAHQASRTAARSVGGEDTLSNVADLGPRLASHEAAPDVRLSAEERYERAASLCDYLKSARPELYADPGLRFAAAAAQRSRGFTKDSEREALLISKRTVAEAWRRAAAAERWLAEPEGLPPEKPIAMCRHTPKRPKLDAALDEACWRRAEPIAIGPGVGDPTAVVRFARDDAFLYLAIEAIEEPDAEPIDAVATRPRDADLAMHDRVRLRIDLDRDYTTAFELTIDRRGWTHDALWGDRHWNPEWYVAAEPTDSESGPVWRAEAAIPLRELAPPEQLARAAWALSVERLTPSKSITSWAGDGAQSDSPDAFGLLLLE